MNAGTVLCCTNISTDFHVFLSDQVLQTISQPTIRSMVRNVILNLPQTQVTKCNKWFLSIHYTTLILLCISLGEAREHLYCESTDKLLWLTTVNASLL